MSTKLLYVAIASVMLVILAAQPALAARYSTTQPIASSPEYGYLTTQGAGNDQTIDVKALQKWTVSSKTWKFNGSGCSGLTLDQCRTEVINAANRWKNVVGATVPTFSYSSPDISTKPSMFSDVCGTGTSSTNSVNEIGFCDTASQGGFGMVRTSPAYYALPAGHPSVTICDPASVSQPCSMAEADMVLNIQSYSSSQLATLALHEFGHWLPLADLRSIDGFWCVGNHADAKQIMCDGSSALQHGDKAGARLLYPKTYDYLLTTNTVKGADIALGSVDATSNKDLLVVWGDYVSPNTTIKIKPLWNIVQPPSTDPATDTSDPSTLGAATTDGTISTLFSIPSAATDIGATLATINSGTTPDLVITFTNATRTYYRVYFDLTRSSNAVTWTSSSSIISIPNSAGDQGTDVEVFDITGDGAKDLVVLDSRTGKLWYFIGKSITTSGTIPAGNWFNGASSNSFTASGSYIGSATLDSSARIVNLVFKDAASSYPRYNGLKFNTGDTAPISNSADSMYKFGTLGQFGTIYGIGSAADNLDPSYTSQPEFANYKEQFFARVGFTGTEYRIYYTIDWQSRINAHG